MNPFLRTFLDGPIRVIVLRMHRSTLSVQLSLQNSDRRKKYLDGDFEKRLKEICLEVANEARFEIRELECDRNHIHPLIDVDPQFGAHRAVKHMKGRSSRILRQEFAILRQRLPTLWSFWEGIYNVFVSDFFAILRLGISCNSSSQNATGPMV